MNGKGSARRPSLVPRREYEQNWARTFCRKPNSLGACCPKCNRRALVIDDGMTRCIDCGFLEEIDHE